MPRLTREEDEWHGDHNPDPGQDDLGFREEDDDLCIPCPYCGNRILEESERCPHCEHYVSREDAPRPGKPIWIWAGVVACLYVVYRWIFW